MPLNAPDVYVQEQSGLLAPELSGADTVAAFIGYTEKGPLLTPTRIRSLREYEKLFGQAEVTRFGVAVDTRPGETASYTLTSPPRLAYYMYHSVQLYFANGGGECQVISVGSYGDTIDVEQLLAGLDLLETVEVDLLLATDAAQLPAQQYYRFCTAMLAQCNVAKDRFAVIDLQDTDTVSGFRNGIGNSYLDYGAAYTPYLVSTLPFRYNDDSVDIAFDYIAIDGGPLVALADVSEDRHIHNIRKLLDQQTVTLPSGGAVAGIYARVDHQRGVWKSPANIPLKAVVRPKIRYSAEDQTPLNVDAATGKSINVIRTFGNKGTLLWGARTLDGNNDDWRYIATRRLFIRIERDLKQIVSAAITQANNSRTWAKVKTAIESYLDQLWQNGALSGAKASDAYFVQVGRGGAMPEQDLSIKVGVAVFRPAEFITVTFTPGASVAS